MAASKISLQPEGAGPAVDAMSVATTAGADVKRQVIGIGDATTGANVASVGNAAPASNAFGLSVRTVGSVSTVAATSASSSGTISSLNGQVALQIPAGCTAVRVFATNTGVSTNSFQISGDGGGTWFDAQGIVEYAQGITPLTSRNYSASNGHMQAIVDVSGANYFRVYNTQFSTGSSSVTLQPIFSSAPQSMAMPIPNGTATIGTVVATGATASGSALGAANPIQIAGSDGTNARSLLTSTSGVLNAQLTGATGTAMLPNPAVVGEGMSNATATQLATFGLLFNGASWDRARGNFNTTIADTGAKTSASTGSVQTNYNARGAKIFLQLGAVSGTSPALSVQLQCSVDGTNFFNYGPPATLSAPASGQTVLIDVYPTDNGGAAVAQGVTAVSTINAALPRIWRLAYTPSGTSPSITISVCSVAYQL